MARARWCGPRNPYKGGMGRTQAVKSSRGVRSRRRVGEVSPRKQGGPFEGFGRSRSQRPTSMAGLPSC